ncbi:MAG: OmpA family protein [Deltaproteobacteria bacterium]|nr:OmpA family protein [Deltaproteobacteria bacterium]
MSTLTDRIQEQLTPDLIQRMSARTGVPGTKVHSGMTSATQAIMGGLTERASDPRAMGRAADVIRDAPDVADPASLLDEQAPARSSTDALLGLVTNNNTGGLIQRLSSSLGLGGGTVGALLATSSGMVMGVLRKFGGTGGRFDAGSLASALLGDKSGARPVGAEAAPAATRHRVESVGRPTRPWWLYVLIPLAVIALWLFARGRRPADTEHARTPAPSTTQQHTATGEEGLRTHLQQQSNAPSQWFELDAMQFPRGGAQVPASAKQQLDRVAKVMSENPSSRIGVGAHDADPKLAQQRADNIKRALVDRGIDESRIDAVGLGKATTRGESWQAAVRALAPEQG